jgi:hypothetical protein
MMGFNNAELAAIRSELRKVVVERYRYHVIPYRNRWVVVENSDPSDRRVVRTRDAAIRQAQELALEFKGEVVVHGRDGRIQEHISFRNSAQ